MLDIQLAPANVLRALANFTDPNDVREYLRGVWVENTRQGLVLWASNGSAAVGMRLGDMAPCESFEVLIPCTAIAMLPKGKLQVDLILGGTEPQLAAAGVRVPCGASSELRMPPIRRIIPREVTHQPGQYDIGLLEKFQQLALALGRKKDVAGRLHLSQNGTDAARVHIPDCPEIVGVLMPLRQHATALPEDQPFTPDWALEARAEESLV